MNTLLIVLTLCAGNMCSQIDVRYRLQWNMENCSSKYQAAVNAAGRTGIELKDFDCQKEVWV